MTPEKVYFFEQNELKAKGHPWELAKCFDTACPISDFIPVSDIPDPHNIELVCRVNGQVRQQDSTSKMLARIPDLIRYKQTNKKNRVCKKVFSE